MEKVTLENIEKELRERITPIHKSAKLYDDGDHWQSGEGFLPFAYMDAVQRAESEARIKLGFVSENVCGKVIDNEQNGLLGREPDWSAVGDDMSEAENERLEQVKTQIEENLVQYWNDRESIKLFREAFRLAATQERAIIRAFLPKGYTGANGQIKTQKDFLSAMKMLQFEVLTAEKGGVFLDDEFYNPFGVFIKESDGKKKIEQSWVDDNNKTWLKITTYTTGQLDAKMTLPSLAKYIPEDKENVSIAKPQDLGGNILIFEINRPALITESVITNQKNVNLGHTMQARTTYQAGHRDAFGLNAQPPTEETRTTAEDGTVTIEEKPVPVTLSGGSMNFLNGAPVFKKTTGGEVELVGYANASMEVLEPVDPENIIKHTESQGAAIYRQCCQEHLYANQDVSGKSKEVSRAPFEKKLVTLKPTFDAFGRWYLTVLAYFGAANSTEIKLEDVKRFRFDFNCIVDAGAPSAEIIATAQADEGAGRLSTETYLSVYRGIEDVDAEIARLQSSESYKLALAKQRLEAAQLAKNLNLPPEYLVELLNVEDDAEKAKLIAALKVEPKEPPTKTEPTNGLPVSV